METEHHAPITLPVADLQASSSFYLSALQPLGYQHISVPQNKTERSESQGLGLGPVNTSRIDIVLLPSQNLPNSRSCGKASHLIFPAASCIAVRDFYTAALNAGGCIVSRPAQLDNGAEFTATVADFDGNEVEVGYTDPNLRASPFPKSGEAAARPTSNFIQAWRQTVAEHDTTRDIQALPPNGRSLDSIPSQTKPQAGARRASISSSKKSGSSPKDSGSVPSNKLFGTLLGAAASVAVVYAFTQELQDSKEKEAKFSDRMEARRRLRAEAKARAIATEWRDKTRDSRRRRRSSLTDRDSGYHSRRTPSPGLVRYRTFVYEPVPDPRRDGQSQTSSRIATRTMDPAPENRRDSSSRTSSRTTTRLIEPAPAPQKSQSSKAGLSREPSVRSRPPTHVTVSTPPSRPPRPSPRHGQPNPLPERSATSKSRSATRQVAPPRDDEFPAKTPSRDYRRSSGPATKTIRYVPVTAPLREPSQTSKRSRAEESQQQRSSYVQEAMGPPAMDPDKLTHSRRPEEYIDQLDLDDETVVPDDSISCVSTDVGPQHRAKGSRQTSSFNSRSRPRRKMGVAY